MNRTIQVFAALSRITRQYIRDKDGVLDALFDESKRLGGVYVKFLQQIASSEYAASHLSSLTDNFDVYDRVATEPLDIKTTLIAEFGDEAANFKLLNGGEPIASGSFAQVYLANHHELGKIIIKVLRPSVVENLDTDLRLLRILSYLLQPALPNDLISAPQLAKEFIRATRRETNYQEETRLANYLREYFLKRSSSIYIPKTYKSFTTSSILVQEYVEGIKLSDIVTKVQADENAAEYVKKQISSDLHLQLENFGSELLSSLFFADYIMADPHPGNVILLPDNRVALIDFGLVAAAPARRSVFYNIILQYRYIYENKSDLSSLTIAMIAFFDYDLYSALKIYAQIFGSSLTDIRNTIARFAIPENVQTNYKLTESRFVSLVMQDINVNNQLGMQISPQNVVLQKAMRSCLVSVKLSCNTIDEYNSVIYKSLVRAEEEACRRGVKELPAKDYNLTPDQSREIVVDWLGKLAERNEILFRSLIKEAQP